MANLTPAEELQQLRDQNAALKTKLEARQKVSFKVGEKGALSMYGLGRFPITLYSTQWNRLLAHVTDIQAALIENVDKLAVKPE